MKHSNKLESALQYLQDKHSAEYCPTYGEPGYSDPVKGIIFANWNNVPYGLQKWLEKCGYELEWFDEWMIDYDNNKAYRTSADCYQWECPVVLPDEACDFITPDDSDEIWIEACRVTSNGQPIRCLPSRISDASIIEAGFTLQNGDCESGFFPGQTDNPVDIVKHLIDIGAYRVVFRKTENSQFYVKFQVFADMVGASE